MPTFVNHLSTGVIRKTPLGPVTLNQMQQNAEVIDALALGEHFAVGGHNALEVPWVLGAISSGTTGYLFDTTYGGTTLARPATGRVTCSVASGVIGTATGVAGSAVPAASVLANVSDAAIATYPHVVEAELVSATSIELRTRYMTSTLGSLGNAWSTVAVGVDLAVHAQKQPRSTSLLASRLTKSRRDFLTEQATDWNALVQNQGYLRKCLSLEHTSAGEHLVDRIAKAWGWFKPAAGPSFSIISSQGVKAVTWISTGVVEVELDNKLALSSANLGACFPQAQPASADELVIVNGRVHSAGTAGVAAAKFRFYIYQYSVGEDIWRRADRSFSAVMFGRPA